MADTTILRQLLQHKSEHGVIPNTRLGRAYELLINGHVHVDPTAQGRTYEVDSQKPGIGSEFPYPVSVGWGISCGCPDFQKRKQQAQERRETPTACKHILACWMGEEAAAAARKHAAQKGIDMTAYVAEAQRARELPHPLGLAPYLAGLEAGARLALEIDAKRARWEAGRHQSAEQIALIVRYPVSGCRDDPNIMGPGEVVEVRTNGSPRKPDPYPVDVAEAWLTNKGYVAVADRWIDGSGSVRRRHVTYQLEEAV